MSREGNDELVTRLRGLWSRVVILGQVRLDRLGSGEPVVPQFDAPDVSSSDQKGEVACGQPTESGCLSQSDQLAKAREVVTVVISIMCHYVDSQDAIVRSTELSLDHQGLQVHTRSDARTDNLRRIKNHAPIAVASVKAVCRPYRHTLLHDANSNPHRSTAQIWVRANVGHSPIKGRLQRFGPYTVHRICILCDVGYTKIIEIRASYCLPSQLEC